MCWLLWFDWLWLVWVVELAFRFWFGYCCKFGYVWLFCLVGLLVFFVVGW